MTNYLKHAVRFVLAVLLYYSGVLAICHRMRRNVHKTGELIVLGLHRVLTAEEYAATGSDASMVVMLPTFTCLLELLRKDFEVVSFAQVQRGETGIEGKPKCLLTFDDAWLDTFINVVPVLRDAGLTAMVFVPTALLGCQKNFWTESLTCIWRQGGEAQRAVRSAVLCAIHLETTTLSEVIAALKEMPLEKRDAVIDALCRKHPGVKPPVTDSFMSWEQLEQSAPQLEIGSHTIHHVLLDKEDDRVARHELAESREELHRRTGLDVRALAYPNGNHNHLVRHWARKAGYKWAFTAHAGIFRADGDRMRVPRMLIQESNLTNPWGRFSPAMTHLRLMGWR